MKKTLLMAAAAGLAIAAGSASAQVFSSATLPKNLLDSPTISDAITVSGGPVAIADVNVVFRVTHTFDGDVDAVLVGPGALGYITLTTDCGSSGDNFSTTRFDDAATTSITSGTAPFNGNFKPENTFNGWAGTPATFTGTSRPNLAGFNGQDSNGTWTLYLDDDGSGDTGVLQYWSLEFDGAVDPQGPPPVNAPTNPTGVGSYNPVSLAAGATTNMRVTVTPGTNPASTFGNPGTGVTINGASISAGTITLFNDGLHNDGAANDAIWGADVVIPNSVAAGTYVLPFAILDNQARTGTGNMPTLTILPPPPSCPAGLQPVSFTNVNSVDVAGDTTPGNQFVTLGWTGSDLIDKIHVSGRLLEVNTATYASEARFRVRFSDSTFVDLQPFATDSFTGTIDVVDYISPAINKPVSSIVSVEAFDNFDDTTDGTDSRWLNLCFSYDALLQPTNPTGVGSATPGSGTVGEAVTLSVVVSAGLNPVSTFANPGSGVSVDASLIDAGTVTLFDDGMHSDGGAGDGTWANTTTVGAGATSGAKSLPFTITDDQARNGAGTIAYTVVPPAPGCPAGSEPASFTNLVSFGPQGDANNSVSLTGFTSSTVVNKLHFGGRQDTDGSTGSFSSESRIRVNFSDSTFQLFQPIPAGSGSDIFDITDAVMTLTTPRPANQIVSFETYDSFDDPGQDATWPKLCVTWEATSTNPSGVGSLSGAVCGSYTNGATVQFNVTVTPGTNPAGTFANPGSGVTVNAASIGGGTVTLFDDGMHNDGGAGDLNYGGSAVITVGAGTYATGYSITDDQGRNGAGSFASISVVDYTGQLPASAADYSGASAVTLPASGGLVYRIEVCDPSTFVATTVDAGTTADTQLFLFDANGVGLAMNDDSTGSASTITGAAACPGIYYLAVSGYDADPINSDCAQIWADSPFGTQRAPDGVGAANPVMTGWVGSGASGSFVLTLTGAGTPGSCGATCVTDLNEDGNPDQGDVDCLISVVAGDPTCLTNACFDADFNHDGNVDQGDIDALITVIAGGACP